MADLNLSADVTDLVRARREIRQWSKQTSDAIDIVNSRMRVLGDTSPVALTKFGGSAQVATRGMNRMGMVTQQAGYQVGDFLVQVQSGTNAFVAFGQQATQLVGLMGMFNPALIGVGAALGIAIPLVTAFGAAWLRTRQEQDSAASSAEDLKGQIESIDEALKDYINTARAAARGVSLEEVFSIDEISRAEEGLREANAQLERLTNVSAGDPSAGMAAIAEPFMGLLGRDSASQAEAAAQAVIDAEERLARLRRMQSGERASEFVNTQQELQQEIELQRAILEFGENSLQVEALRNSQNLESQIQQIQNQVRLGELTETQGLNQERLVRLQSQLTVEQQRANRGIEVYNENLEAQQRLVEDRNQAVENIQRSLQQELTTQQNLLDLAEAEATYGRDSREYSELVTQQEREQYRLRLMSNGLLGNNLKQIMAIYDKMVTAADEAERVTAALNSISNLDELPFTVQVAALADMLGIAADEALRLMNNLPVGVTYGDPSALAGLTSDQLLFGGMEGDVPSSRTGGGGGQTQTIQEIIDRRQEQLNLEQELLGLSEERAAARRIEAELEAQYQGEVTETMRDQIEAAAASMAAQEEQIQKLEDIRDRNQDIADTIADSFGNALTSVIDGTKSVGDAFKSMARAIIAELFQIMVVKRITGFISGAIMGAFGGGGGVSKMASGGLMSPNTPYLVGERGPELVMPNRQSTIMNADLTSKALGGSNGETVVVNQTINVSTGVQQTVRNEIQSLMPQISEAAKIAVVDAKRRGGGYGRAFS